MKVIYLLIVVFFVISCNSNTSDTSTFKNLTTDTLTGGYQSITKAFNLPLIDKGVDSFELRVWHGVTIATPNYLTILRFQDSEWTISQTDYWIDYQWNQGRPEKVILDSLKTKSFTVPPSISQIVDSIIKFRLDTFPTQAAILGFRDNTGDGIFYDIEIATSEYYKLLKYHNPDRFKDSYNRKMTGFIKTLNRIGVF